jgi:hypothetical protein
MMRAWRACALASTQSVNAPAIDAELFLDDGRSPSVAAAGAIKGGLVFAVSK